MPAPRPNETRKDYIARCVPVVLDDGTAESRDQAVAVCQSMWEKSRESRQLSGSVDSASIRTETLFGRQYLVVPVVASVADIAIRAQGSEGHSELIPSEELAISTVMWNGRPVVFRHPVGPNGEPLSANDPAVLDAYGIGWIFASRFDSNRLKVEAWVDMERVAALGDDAQAALDTVRAGQMIEVSVGCLVSAVEVEGRDAAGNAYTRAWTNIRPDHLAFLPVGEIGACSNKAGCGAPRASLRAAHRMEVSTMILFQKLLSKLRIGNEETGPSDDELRYKLATVLHATEPAFDGVIAVYPESATVIYSCSPEGSYKTKRRGYTLAENGDVTLADDAEDVEARVEFVPVQATATQPKNVGEGGGDTTAAAAAGAVPVGTPPSPSQSPASASCGCGDHRKAADHNRGVKKMTNKELAERLIACEGSPFTEEDRENLEAFSPERLAALAEQLDPTKPAPEPEPKPRTAEQWLAEAPPEVRELVSRHQTEEKARHATLVASLKGLPQVKAIYDEARLASLTVPQLVEVATLVGLTEQPTFHGVVLPDSPRGAEDGTPPPSPRPYDVALKSRREAAAKAN